MDTINSVSPNYAVVLFFAAGAIISAFLSWRFVSASAPPLRPFGIGLAFLAVAFAIWAFVVWNRSDSLALWSSIGVVAFLPSYYFFLRAATHNWLPKNRNIVLAIARRVSGDSVRTANVRLSVRAGIQRARLVLLQRASVGASDVHILLRRRVYAGGVLSRASDEPALACQNHPSMLQRGDSLAE